MFYFYVLQSQKDPQWFYKGSTPDLRRRVQQHSDGAVVSTKGYRPLQLVYYEAYCSEQAVRLREMSVKKSGSVWKPLMKRIRESLLE